MNVCLVPFIAPLTREDEDKLSFKEYTYLHYKFQTTARQLFGTAKQFVPNENSRFFNWPAFLNCIGSDPSRGMLRDDMINQPIQSVEEMVKNIGGFLYNCPALSGCSSYPP